MGFKFFEKCTFCTTVILTKINCRSNEEYILFYFWISPCLQQEYMKMLKSRIEVGYETISHSYLKKYYNRTMNAHKMLTAI